MCARAGGANTYRLCASPFLKEFCMVRLHLYLNPATRGAPRAAGFRRPERTSGVKATTHTKRAQSVPLEIVSNFVQYTPPKFGIQIFAKNMHAVYILKCADEKLRARWREFRRALAFLPSQFFVFRFAKCAAIGMIERAEKNMTLEI